MEKLRSLAKGSFAKSVIVLTGGAVFAQALNFLISPVITRIYSPSDYGIMTIYNTVLGIVSLIGALSYEEAIPIADDDEKAINIFSISVLILSMITIIITVSFYFFGADLLKLLNALVIEEYKYFIPIGFFIVGLYMIGTKWAFRKKDFKALARSTYSQSIVGSTTKVGLGLLSFGPMGLILGRIIGEGIGVLTLMFTIKNGNENILKKIDKKTMKWTANRYIKFPLFSAPTIFLTSLSSQIPIILMSTLYGAEVVGLYGLAFTVTSLPITLIGKAIQDVFHGESASLSQTNPKRIKELLDKLMLKLILLAAIPMIILIAFGPLLFQIVFGEKWIEAGVYSRLITISIFASFIFQPSGAIFIVFEEQSQFLYLNIARLILVIILFQIVKVLALDSYTTIFILSFLMSIIEFFKYIMAQKILKRKIIWVGSDD